MEQIGVTTTAILERIKQLRQSEPESSYQTGSPPQTLAVDYECPKCRDQTGYMITLDDGRDAWRICDCAVRKRVKRLMKSSHITPEFQAYTFDGFVTANRPACVVNAHRSAVYYAGHFPDIRDRRRNSMAFLGPPGSGKTRLMIAACNELIAHGVSVHYFPWVEGSNDLRDAVKGGDSVQELLGAMKAAELLFVDDLFKGRDKPTPFQLECLFDVINHRYLNHGPIFVSSERDIDSMCDVDEGLGSRIYEMCRDFLVPMVLTESERKSGTELNFRLLKEVAK